MNASESFRATYGTAADVAWSAPGRVNLIGEHTDYNDGYVLPFALGHRTQVAAGLDDGEGWTVSSTLGGAPVEFGVPDLTPGAVTCWAAYVAGIVWALREAGVAVPPARLVISSDIPVGAGLSSSAALECATLGTLLDLASLTGAGPDSAIPVSQWPALAQRAENAYVGVPCGIMDQAASSLCESGRALFLDCRSLDVDQVPFDLAAAGLAVLVIDTNAPHQHAGGEYAARRATCEAAARSLGVPALRDVTDLPAALAALDDETMRRLTRHVATENARVLETVALLREGRVDAIGELLTASHRSLRDDYKVTVPELDLAVEVALEAGALGARMTGGGFGGCVLALVAADRVDHVATAVADAFQVQRFGAPSTFAATPHGGVARIDAAEVVVPAR